jgi:hypothetical protein
MRPSPYTVAIFALLGVMAALLLISLVAGFPVPRWAFVILIIGQAILRVLRDASQPALRNRNLFQLGISALLSYFILTVT